MLQPSRVIRGELLVLLVVLGAATVVFWKTRLDLAVAALFWVPCCSWPMAEQPFWHLLYRYGVLAGVLLAAGALVALTLSYWYPRRLLAWRKPALFLVLVAAVGPGLVVNVLFKDHYGRPRPREVQELGGEEPFLPVWVKGSDTQAKSFPCGHCSMGFYLSTPYLLLKRRRRRTGYAVLAAGLVYGGLMGVARMMAGGHFLSDVLWAGGMTWIVALALHRLLRLDQQPAVAGAAEPDWRRARLATALAGGALGVLTVAALLATPYLSAKTFSRTRAELTARGTKVLDVELDEGTVSVGAGPDFEASYQVRAFGFPTSRMSFAFRQEGDGGWLTIDRLGWFTERRTAMRLQLPRDGDLRVRVRLGKGKLSLDQRAFAPNARLDVEVGEGEIRVLGASPSGAGDGIRLRVGRGRIVRE